MHRMTPQAVQHSENETTSNAPGESMHEALVEAPTVAQTKCSEDARKHSNRASLERNSGCVPDALENMVDGKGGLEGVSLTGMPRAGPSANLVCL